MGEETARIGLEVGLVAEADGSEAPIRDLSDGTGVGSGTGVVRRTFDASASISTIARGSFDASSFISAVARGSFDGSTFISGFILDSGLKNVVSVEDIHIRRKCLPFSTTIHRVRLAPISA